MVVIPARAGSQRIVDKNNKKIGEKTLVDWAIECALTVFPKDRIVLVTDSDRSSASGRKYGINVLERPEEISAPDSSTESLIEFVMERYEAQNYVLLQPTSPFRTKSDIQICIEHFEKFDLDAVMGVTLPWHSPKDLYTVSKDFGKYFAPKKIFLEKQKDYYFDTGAIYVFKQKLIQNNLPIVSDDYTHAVEINQMAFFDIDYTFHLALANTYFAMSGWEFDR